MISVFLVLKIANPYMVDPLKSCANFNLKKTWIHARVEFLIRFGYGFEFY